MPEDIKEKAKSLAPEPLKKFAEGKVKHIDDVFVGAYYEGIRESLKSKGVAQIQDQTVAVDLDKDGNILAMAAAVSRTPTRSDVFLDTNVPDLSTTGGLTRKDKIAQYHSLSKKEGIIGNALNKKASLISQDGNFEVRMARQGRRPRASVVSEIMELLKWWQENVNSSPEEGAITGSRGIKQVVRRGARQAMIEGDLFLRQIWTSVSVPTLGNKKYNLPMTLQAFPSADIEIAEDLEGLGFELFYWKPERSKIQKIVNSRDPAVREIVKKTMDPQILSELIKTGKVLLDPALLIHLKNSSIDPEAYGRSDIESAITDVAYSRALKNLDFVTIDSLINRMVVVKIGDPDSNSDYHNLAVAQARTNVFRKLISTVGPNMLIVWAGHDVGALDIGAHDKLLDTTQRHELASAATKMATGVPDPVLTGSADGGNAVAWAGFISLSTVVGELQEEWAQALSQLGKRIAVENKFEDSDVAWKFARTLLADREANAKVMQIAFDRGLISHRSMLEELGMDFDVEKSRHQEFDENEDEELFMPPPITLGGIAGEQGTDPGSSPGRPGRQKEQKVGPDRDREERKVSQ